MSVEDVRQQKAMALLQYEEAKQALTDLHEEAKRLAYLLSAIAEFCGDLPRPGSIRSQYGVSRSKEVLAHNQADDFRRAMDYDALVKLHDRIVEADKIVRQSEEVKRSLGLK